MSKRLGRLQMPLRLALGVRGTVAGHRLGALEGVPPPLPMHPWGGGGGLAKHGGFWQIFGRHRHRNAA